MDTDGGGWTLIHKSDHTNNNDRTDSGNYFEGLKTSTLDSVAVLPRNVMKLMSKDLTYRIMSSNGYKFYWKGAPYYTTDAHASESYTVVAKTAWSQTWATGTYNNVNSAHAICISVLILLPFLRCVDRTHLTFFFF